MEQKSIRKVIETVESLNVGDVVRFIDVNENMYVGEVTEHRPNSNNKHKDYEVEGDNTTRDCVLEVWYDPQGGPINVQVSFNDNTRKEVKNIESDS